MAAPFRRIGLFGRTGTPGVKDTLRSLIQYLTDFPRPVSLEQETALHLDETDLPVIAKEELAAYCDLLIVVGGDGSLLHAAHTAVEQQLPVLGINRGSLGFLTDIGPTALDRIGRILEGHYRTEERFLLTATVSQADAPSTTDDALNEVAMMPATFPHMLDFEIYINDEFVCSLHADGMIVATPTGSTAYALSGGGPILHPRLDAIVLVPMFPHSLSQRPIVVEGNAAVSIILSPDNRSASRLSCDGRPCLTLPPGCQIRILKKNQSLTLVHPTDYCYYKALRSKLQWGKKLIDGAREPC